MGAQSPVHLDMSGTALWKVGGGGVIGSLGEGERIKGKGEGGMEPVDGERPCPLQCEILQISALSFPYYANCQLNL